MHRPGAPVRRPVTSAAKPADPSWAVSTNGRPPSRIASSSGRTLPLGMPNPCETPASRSVRTINSALFIAGDPALASLGKVVAQIRRAHRRVEIAECPLVLHLSDGGQEAAKGGPVQRGGEADALDAGCLQLGDGEGSAGNAHHEVDRPGD